VELRIERIVEPYGYSRKPRVTLHDVAVLREPMDDRRMIEQVAETVYRRKVRVARHQNNRTTNARQDMFDEGREEICFHVHDVAIDFTCHLSQVFDRQLMPPRATNIAAEIHDNV